MDTKTTAHEVENLEAGREPTDYILRMTFNCINTATTVDEALANMRFSISEILAAIAVIQNNKQK